MQSYDPGRTDQTTPDYDNDPLVELARIIGDDDFEDISQPQAPSRGPAAQVGQSGYGRLRPTLRPVPQPAEEPEDAFADVGWPAIVGGAGDSQADAPLDDGLGWPDDDYYGALTPDAAAEPPPLTADRYEPLDRGRSRGLATLIGVVGVVLLGGVGYAAYDWLGTPTASEPTVIAAPDGPIRVAAAEEAQPIGVIAPDVTLGGVVEEPKDDERLVPRAEDIVAALPATGGIAPTAPNNGSRFVSTYVVRPDGTMVPTPTSGGADPVASILGGETQAAATAEVPPATTTAAADTPAPLGTDGAPAILSATDIAPAATPVTTTTVTPPPAAAEPPPATETTPAATAEATAPAAEAVPAATPGELVATANPPPGFYAQLSSQGSEAAARSSWAALIEQFPSILNGQQPVIQTAAVNGNTVFRVRVGPFESSREANQLCSRITGAGGACYVPAG